jgi:hypothetical protein
MTIDGDVFSLAALGGVAVASTISQCVKDFSRLFRSVWLLSCGMTDTRHYQRRCRQEKLGDAACDRYRRSPRLARVRWHRASRRRRLHYLDSGSLYRPSLKASRRHRRQRQARLAAWPSRSTLR